MIFKKIKRDIDAFMSRDPAARSRWEVVLCYSGFHALLFHRFSSRLWRWKWFLLARFISHISRFLTGVEIHPGATIGPGCVIDHGHGVVIGETATIGKNVTLYQSVTLGGVLPSVDSHMQVNQKRHPTLEEGVIVGSGAQVLGPVTVGANARVGANAVVHKDVPAGTIAVGIPARIVLPKNKKKMKEFVAYGEPVEGSPDPMLQTVIELRSHIESLMGKMEGLEKRLNEGEKYEKDKTPPLTSSLKETRATEIKKKERTVK